MQSGATAGQVQSPETSWLKLLERRPILNQRRPYIMKKLVHPWLPKALILVLLLTASSLFAERRNYESNQPLGALVARLVEELNESNQPFTVTRVYNAERDGKQGMVLLFGSQRSICELTFHEAPGGRTSAIRMMAQEPVVANLIHQLLTTKLGMRELGVSNTPPAQSDWPVRP